ncbi:MAG TPA: hypothetical protein VMZ22_00655 [Acidimicrobiales bacterium]|nr:hypothetical protein [Acidimicrobiales bacterium]
MARRNLIASVAVAALLAAGCSDPAVRVSYRPKVGTRTSYELRVTTRTTTELEGEGRTRGHESFALRSDQRVRRARAGADTQVGVRLSGAGQAPRDFVVRLDRAGQLATVESVEGVPSETLGDLGISELLPSAAGALPRAALRPGDRWRISQLLRSDSVPAGRLVGWGRLASLGVSDGTKLAIVDTEVALPVDRTTEFDTGVTGRLIGAIRTTMHVVQRVSDGVVLQARARSVGRYEVTLSPPSQLVGPPVTGTLTVIVSSTTKAR